MSTTETRHDEADRRRGRREGRPEARGGRHPGLGRRPSEGVLRPARVAARRRLRLRQRLPGRPVHPSRLGVLDPVRHEDHVGRAGLGPGPLPDRLRHRGRARRARRPRRRRQRGVPRRDARRSVPARRRGSRQRAGARAGAATAPSPRSATPTATAGCCRRSRPGCPAASTPPRRRYASAADLASAMRRASAAHGEHEKRTGERDENWPDWYAAYMVAEQAGEELPT